MTSPSLFVFGCVIFIIVMTGVFWWGLAVVGEMAERDRQQQ